MADRIELDAGRSPLSQLDDFIAWFADRCSLEQGESARLAIVLEELMTNVAKYAYPADAGSKAVAITLARDEDRLIIEFEDQGRPFDPLAYQLPDLEAALDDRPEGHLGIHILRQLADEITYRRADGRNIVRIVKYMLEQSGGDG